MEDDRVAYKIHPAADAMPRMTQDEFNELVRDIEKNGLLVPVELYKGQVIDGRSRLEACALLGVEPEFIDVNLTDVSPGEYVWSLNGARRHLTPSQKACVAVDLLPHFEEEAKQRQKLSGGRGQKGREKGPDLNAGKATENAAAAVGTNPKYVSDAKAVKQADPELFNAVKNGTTKLTQAKQEIKRRQKRAELQEKAKAVKPSDKCRVILGDCCEELPKLSKVRLIFADPPYNIGIDYGQGKQADRLDDDVYKRWCAEWIAKSAAALANDGSLWVLVQDEYVEYLACELNDAGLYRRAWIKWYETFGVNRSNNFNRTSRHLLYYVADPKHVVFNADAVTRPSDRQAKYNDKRAAESGKIWDDVWQIPRVTGTSNERVPDVPTQLPLDLLRAVVGCASDPGDLVVDPFSGSGTTGVACKQLGRKFIGIEKEERFWEIANVRIASCDV